MANYVDGSDLLMFVGGKAIGHCTSCTVSYSAETKDRKVKPVASEASGAAGKWKAKSVSGLSCSLSFEGLVYDGETESGYAELERLMLAGEPIQCKYAHRGEETTKYHSGMFVLTSLEQQRPAGEDATYSGTLENSGEVTEYPAP